MYKILIVDDDTSTLRALRELLGGEGYEVTTSTDPLQALNEIRRGKFDVVLSDIRMPEMSGVDLVRQCSGLKPGTGLVLMTAYPDLDSALEAERQGVTNYITKPIEPKRLSQAVARAVQARHRPIERLSARRRIRPSVRASRLSPSRVARLPLIKVYGFGEAQVIVGDREVKNHDWQNQKAKQLLFYLVSQCAKSHKEEIVEALWPDQPWGKMDSAFHSAAYRLRQAVHPDCLLYTENSYWLNPNMP